MISQREVERRYNAIFKHYAKEAIRGVNCYTCDICGHVFKTKDVDPGVTPMVTDCFKCGGYAKSSWYVDIKPEQRVTGEWYRPSLKEVLKMRKRPYRLEHVLNGGLELRTI